MGKSSLLDALTLLLSPEFDLYHFVRDDFWFPRATSGREHHLHIIPTFRETEPPPSGPAFPSASALLVPCDDGYHRCSIARRASSPKMTA